MKKQTHKGRRSCRYLRIELIAPWDKDYLKARGIKQIDSYFPTIEIPHRCPQLRKDGSCKLGNKKPKICKRRHYENFNYR